MLGGLSGFLSRFLVKESWTIQWSVFKLKKLYDLNLIINLDWISLIFFRVLRVIVSCVLVFSKFYLADDPFFSRFSSILLMFVFSMCLLIFIPHFVILLIGWDGLGFTSFLLIVYYSSFSSWSSGLKTYLINRLGDGFLLVSLVMLFNQGHWKILGLDKLIRIVVFFCLIFGLFTKSAQFPFSSWLPAAMAAPTPVSALVHSSTLVTAGIYLLIRFSGVLPNSVLIIISLTGVWTLFSASFAACVEWDLKKIIAFSTLSQLGLMCFSIGLGMRFFGFFHLLTHAVFKAMLFISAGFFIGQNFHLQDIRSLKGFGLNSPILGARFLIGILALSGFPFLAGFFSKDIIIESNLFKLKIFFLGIFLLSLPFTVFYRFRVFYWLFHNTKKGNLAILPFSHINLLALGPLFLCSLFLGSFVKHFLEKCFFPSLRFKLLILFLLLRGFYFRLKEIFFRGEILWMWKKIKFMEPLKRLFLVKKFSFLGKILFMVDQNLIFQFESFFNKKILSKRVYLKSLKSYFRRIKMAFYLLSGFSVMLWLIVFL